MKPRNSLKTAATLFVISFVLAVNGYSQSFLTNGLVAYYPFNGNANDASGNGLNGTVVGATLTTDRFGNANAAYGFNGSSSTITFSPPPLTQVDNWTLSAWINPANFWQGSYPVLVGYDTGLNGDGYGFFLLGSSTLLGIFSGVNWFSSGYSMPATNRWYHVVMLRESGTTKFFVGGIQTVNTFSTTPHPPTAFTIGSATGYGFFNGQVDDVRIYNRALSDSEVGQLYAFEAAPQIVTQPQGQVGYWGMAASFQVGAGSPLPLSYQWYKDGFPISWATNPTLTLTNLDFTDAGSYWVVVSNTVASVSSATAPLVVNPAGVSLGLYPGLTIQGVVGRTYGIQYVTILNTTSQWTTLTSVTLTQPIQLWMDTNTDASLPGNPQRFYRVIAVP